MSDFRECGAGEAVAEVGLAVGRASSGIDLAANESAQSIDGAGGYDPGKVLRRKSFSLTSNQFNAIEELMQRTGFWNLPSRNGGVGLDGSERIVEGATDKYHVVSRWTPSSGPVREIGEKFLSLTEWQYGPFY
ncbi:hypothetical protein GCM10009105_22840 [Dokdonella soli]|uniref:Uncharacterized protein n=1 Tax=Dokdonella soli TaxID=529810 RepID=A0ABP3TRZ2_9GAMM